MSDKLHFGTLILTAALASALSASNAYAEEAGFSESGALQNSKVCAQHQFTDLLAAAQSKKYVLRDKKSGHSVESYVIPSDWQGFGEVYYTMDPTGANTFRWYSGFSSAQGAKVYVESPTVLSFAVPVKNIPFMNDNRQLAQVMQKTLTERAHVKSLKLESIKITPSSDPELKKIAQAYLQTGRQLNPQSRTYPLEAKGIFSYTKDGQVWKAEDTIYIVGWETPMMGGMYSTMMLFNSHISVIYPEKSAALKNTALGIVKTRRIDSEWDEMLAQTRINISSGNINAARKQADIWRNTGEEINSMRRDSWNKQQQSQDRMSKKRTEQTLGITYVKDPFNSGRTIEVNSKSKHVWVDSTGRQINTEDGFYNPNSDRTKNSCEWRKVR